MAFWDGTRWVRETPAQPPPRRRRTRHVLGAIAEAGLITALTFGLIAGTSLAAKGGNSAHTNGSGGHHNNGGGTISIVLLDSTDGLAHFGQQVTFDVSTTATDYPWVTVDCYQSSALVYEQSNGIFPTSLNEIFTLGPTPAWQGGDADCTAYLQNWDEYSKHQRITNLASMTFHVYP